MKGDLDEIKSMLKAVININNTITFSTDSNAAYGVNLTILQGADFSSTFKVRQENKSDFNLTSYSLYAKMKKKVLLLGHQLEEFKFYHWDNKCYWW